MEHVNSRPGEEGEFDSTRSDVDILNYKASSDYVKAVVRDAMSKILSQTNPVKLVEDPYLESGVAYLVVDINPCAPMIREVPVGTQGAFSTLADAKEAARQILQTSIAEAQKSLSELRQVGVEEIHYISL